MRNYHADLMTDLLLKSGDVDKEFSPGFSTLILDDAVKKNDLECVKGLLQNDTNLSPSALACVMWYAIYKHFNDIVECLIKNGADVNQRGLRKSFCDPRISLLSWAVYFRNQNAVRLLMDHKANVNDWDLLGMGALYFAIITKSLLHTKLLLHCGANVNCKDADENSMLHIASVSGYAELIKIIGERMTDVNATNKFGQNALHYAVQNINSFNCIKELLNLFVSVNALDNADETPLFYSLSLRKHKLSELLLSCGAKVNFLSKNYVFPLHLSILSRSTTEITKTILVRGASVDQRTYDGETVLHCACRKNMPEHIRILLDHGADVNIFNKEGKLPLSVFKKEDCQAVRVLLQHIAKLKFLNLPVHSDNLQIIHDNPLFESFFTKCFGTF